MITFKDLFIEGFGSISKPLSFNLNSQGINIIQAENGNGKTTIFSALCWGLFGKSLKHKSTIETWENIRHKGYLGTKVHITFIKDTMDFEIIRTLSYGKGKKLSQLLLLQEGIERNDLRDKKDIQREIENILGFTFDLFKSSVVFGQKMKRIIEEDGPTKKKVFDEAFATEYLQNARKNIEGKLSKEETELNIISVNLNNLLHLKSELELVLKSQEDAKISFEKDKRLSIKALKNRIKLEKESLSKFKSCMVPPDNQIHTIKEEISNLENYLEKLRENKNNLFRLELKYEQLMGDIDTKKKLEKALIKSYSEILTKCPKCGSKLSREIIKKEKEEINKELRICKKSKKVLQSNSTDLYHEICDIKSKIQIDSNIPNTLNKKKSELELLLKVKQSDNTQLEVKKQSIKNLKNNLKSLKSKKLTLDNSLLPKIEKITKDIDEYTLEKKSIESSISLNKWLLKDPLSNSGLKAFIFDEMLGLVNTQLIKYSERLGIKINFGIDLDSAHKDFYITIEKGNDIKFYPDFSGGEQQLINICIAFAIHDVISIDKDTNILIMDEVFESLDPANIEVVSQLIMQKAQGRCIHLVTHNKDFNPTNAHIIYLKNKKGITYISS